jgi:hypothetical protein
LAEATSTSAPASSAARAVAKPIPDVPPTITTRFDVNVMTLPFSLEMY